DGGFEVFANDGFRWAGFFLFLFDLDVAFTAVWAYRTRREDFRLLSHLSFRRRYWFIHYRHPRCCEFKGSSSEGARTAPPSGNRRQPGNLFFQQHAIDYGFRGSRSTEIGTSAPSLIAAWLSICFKAA